MLSIVILGIASLLGSAIIFRHQRFTTWLATGGIVFEAQWLGLTLLQRTVLPTLAEPLWLLAAVIALAVGWGCFANVARLPRASGATLVRDACVVVACLIVVAGAIFVLNRNGATADGGWSMHGFYHGDTATFSALLERSFTTAALVTVNPFAGNGPLEYPTLLHAGWANFLMVLGAENWLTLLPIMVLAFVWLTVPTFFLLADVIFPEPADKWRMWFGVPSRNAVHVLILAVIVYVITLSWDAYIYPQSHFFLTGLFIVLAALLARTAQLGVRQQFLLLPFLWLLGLVLLLANAVTGAAAALLLIVFHAFCAQERGHARPSRTLHACLAVLWILLAIIVGPGEAAWGSPSFSYSAALDMARLAVPVLGVAFSVILQLTRQKLASGFAMGLVALAFFTFFFSQRDIVVANASRFLYHTVLVGFPLTVPLLIRSFYWIRRELVLTSHTVYERTIGSAVIFSGLLLLLLPAAASLAQNSEELLFKNEVRVSQAERVALAWVREHTPPTAVFAAAPGGPWLIPFFTGRALVRTDYWLSPHDDVLTQLTAAFAGDHAAQMSVTEEVAYVYIPTAEKSLWNLNNMKLVFENEAAAIYHVQ